MVISSQNEGSDLWKLEVVKELCELEKKLDLLYHDICEVQEAGKCCRIWSLTNYLLLVGNKSTCDEITVRFY
jgi:protein dispatched 1